MRAQVFKTELTEILGIRHPILCGGLGPGVSDGRYVAAVVKAGGMGFIVSSSPLGVDWFEEQLRICRSLVGDLGFGVNLYVSRFSKGVEYARSLIPLFHKYGVTCVETAGSSPEPLVEDLRAAGVKIVHKVPAVKYAHTAQRIGADVITIVGADCGGHPGVFQISTMVQVAHAAQTIARPFVVGGGIGTGSQLSAALAMGAHGVVMGTRMLVAEELWIHHDYKRMVVGSDGSESVVVKKLLRDHHRVLNNGSARAVLELEASSVVDFEAYRPHVSGHLAHQSYTTGTWENGMLDFGPAAVFASKIASVEEILDEFVDEAVTAAERLDRRLVQSDVRV